MPNENIMGIPTRACINGFTKEDTERLKNALVKQILNDKTVVDVTDDGKIIMANDDGLFLSVDDSVIGLTKDSDDNVIPITVPYLPEDENENPLVPPSRTIMTSDNIAVDPRIVHTTGNEIIAGTKTFSTLISLPAQFNNKFSCNVESTSTWRRLYYTDNSALNNQVLILLVSSAKLSQSTKEDGILIIGGNSGGVKCHWLMKDTGIVVNNFVIVSTVVGVMELWVKNESSNRGIACIKLNETNWGSLTSHWLVDSTTVNANFDYTDTTKYNSYEVSS